MKGGGHARHTHLVVWLALLCALVVRVAAQTEGTRRWTYTATAVRNASILSSPAVRANGVIYFGVAEDTRPAAGRLLALTPEGAPKWAGAVRDGFVTNHWIDSSPAIGGDGIVYFGCWNGIFYALDGETGAKKWEFNIDAAKSPPVGGLPTAGFIESSPSIGADGTIFFGSGDAVFPELSALHAVRPDGTERWRFLVGDRVAASPAIGADGTIYFVSWDGNLYALNANGTERWRRPVEERADGSPAIGRDGTIYVCTPTRGLFAFSPSGNLLWTFPIGASDGGVSLGADGTVYVGSFVDWSLYAVRAPDAQHASPWTKWIYEGDRPISSTPAVRADGRVIVGLARNDAGQGGVVALHPDTGGQEWFYPINESVLSSPAIDDSGRIYVGANDRQLHAIHGNNSPLSTFSAWPMFRRDARHTGRVDPPLTDGRLINLSTRAVIGPEQNLIAGFSMLGSTTKYYLVRAVGPSLVGFGVNEPLRDPTLTVHSQGAAAPLSRNNDWETQLEPGPDIVETAQKVGAFPLLAGSKDAAAIPLLEPGLYTASVGSTDAGRGTALVEVYDAFPEAAGSLLSNLSTRGPVVAGSPLIPGLVVRGSQPVRVLIRAVGPTLAVFGVPGVLAQPRMEIRRQAGGAMLRANQGWMTGGQHVDIIAAGSVVGAFPLPANSADSAALVELTPGDYTITVTGSGGGIGEVLVEVYLLP